MSFEEQMTGMTNDLATPEKRVEMLKDIAEALNEANDVSAAMRAILPRLSAALGLKTAWAFRYDSSRQSFVEVGSSGLPPVLAENNCKALKSGWCECQDQLFHGALGQAVNIVRCSRLRNAQGEKEGLTFHASIPLKTKGQPLGILNVAAPGRQVFTKAALDFLTTVGQQVAIAVDRSALLQEERIRSHQLRALSALTAELTSIVNPDVLLQTAVSRYAQILRYPACGILLPSCEPDGRKSQIVAEATQEGPLCETEYTYGTSDEKQLLDASERMLLGEARSALVERIPETEYFIRIESTEPNAFGVVDHEILSVFAWHLTAVLENAHLYQRSLESAKWIERRKLAADLHDSVSQRLFSAQLLTKSAALLQQSGSDEELTKALVSVQELIAGSLKEMKALIETLRPVEERGIISTIRERLEPLQLQHETRIVMRVRGTADVFLPLKKKQAILGVIDEALQNVLKHASAKHTYVSLDVKDGRLLVKIQDDGCGFSQDDTEQGLGLTTMRERIYNAGGKFHLQSDVGLGTTLLIEMGFNDVF